MSTLLFQQIVASIAGALAVFFMGAVARFAKSVKENTEKLNEIGESLRRHIENHPTS